MKCRQWKPIFVLLVVLVLVSGCTQSGKTNSTGLGQGNQSPEKATDQIENMTQKTTSVTEKQPTKIGDTPILKGLGVEIGTWDKGKGSAGDFLFSRYVLFEDSYIKNDKVLFEFGATGHLKGSENRNIEYWFFLKPETKIKAPVGGKVRLSFIEHTKDWAVNIQQDGSDYIVSFEHLLNLEVEDGSLVEVGDVLGEAVPWSANNGVGFTELAVWKGGREIIKYCPFSFLDESLKPVYEEKLNRLASDWEEFIGKDVYRQEDWIDPGCLTESIREA